MVLIFLISTRRRMALVLLILLLRLTLLSVGGGLVVVTLEALVSVYFFTYLLYPNKRLFPRVDLFFFFLLCRYRGVS